MHGRVGEGTLAVGGVEVLDEGGEGVELGGGSVPRVELAGGERVRGASGERLPADQNLLGVCL